MKGSGRKHFYSKQVLIMINELTHKYLSLRMDIWHGVFVKLMNEQPTCKVYKNLEF